jgi:hypothetical protein
VVDEQATDLLSAISTSSRQYGSGGQTQFGMLGRRRRGGRTHLHVAPRSSVVQRGLTLLVHCVDFRPGMQQLVDDVILACSGYKSIEASKV